MRPDHDLDRFVIAQAPVYAKVLAELRVGRKISHWMWFIFPQLSGLGRSALAQYYGITGLAEARAYLDHPILGERLRACTRIVIDTPASSLRYIFGTPDDLKFCSSMTLFAEAVGKDNASFKAAIERWCGGPDKATLRLLESAWNLLKAGATAPWSRAARYRAAGSDGAPASAIPRCRAATDG